MLLNQLNTHVLYPALEKFLGRDIRAKLRTLEVNAKLPKSQRQAQRNHRIYEILESAKQWVPYYRDLFRAQNFDPEHIKSDIRYLNELPYLTKEIIREQGSRMLDERISVDRLHLRKTGGSTGISTHIYYDQEALDWTAAANLYSQSISGRRPVDQEVHLSTRFTEPQSLKAGFIEAMKCIALNRTNVYTQDFSDQALDELWAVLKRQSPFLLQGHPSTFYALALHLKNQNIPAEGIIQVFESTGESIDDKKVKAIESCFGSKVYNRYGTAEFGVTAHSRANPHELEIIDSIVYHETCSLGNGLDEIVGTTTCNFAMPLIRYRSGDIGEIRTDEECDSIIRLQGRVHDLIELNGKIFPTHYLQDILDRIGAIEEFQIVKHADGKKSLNVVLSSETTRDAIVKKMNELFGESLPVKFIKFDQLVLSGWRDKFRYVVSD